MTQKTSSRFYHFDWDDNVMKMPTKIIYFRKDDACPSLPQELKISTAFFADSREKVGTHHMLTRYTIINGHAVQTHHGEHEVNLIDYAICKENDRSFREFRDNDECNFFIENLKEALAEKTFAPSFNDFVEALSTPEQAKNTSIITARGQSPETIYQAIVYLKELGYVKNEVPLKNIFPVSYVNLPLEFKGTDANPSEAKKRVLNKLITDFSSEVESGTVGFSDDDKKTHSMIKDFVEEQKSQGKWSNLEINVYFTGTDTKERSKF